LSFSRGLLTEEQMLAIFNEVSKMEYTIIDESGASKKALIDYFCNAVVATGIVIDPDEFTPESCYEVIGYQCKNKTQIYTFMRLMFANRNLDLETKVQFMNGLARLDEQGIKDLDRILDK
jgi:hypothetical protein